MKKKLTAILISLCLAAGQAPPALAAQFAEESVIADQAAAQSRESLLSSSVQMTGNAAESSAAVSAGSKTDSSTITGKDAADAADNMTAASSDAVIAEAADSSAGAADTQDSSSADAADSSSGAAGGQDSNSAGDADNSADSADGQDSDSAGDADSSAGGTGTQEPAPAEAADSSEDGTGTQEPAPAEVADSSEDSTGTQEPAPAEAADSSEDSTGTQEPAPAEAADSPSDGADSSSDAAGGQDSNSAEAADSSEDAAGTQEPTPAEVADSSEDRAGTQEPVPAEAADSSDSAAADSGAQVEAGDASENSDTSSESSAKKAEAVPEEEEVPMAPALTSEAAGTDKIFSSPAPVSGRTYQILCAYEQSMLVDVGKDYMKKGSNVRIFENKKYYRQYFTFIKNSDSTWTILNYKTGKVLAVNGTVKAKANVCQWEDKGKTTQRWKLKKNADGSYSFRIAAKTSLALEVSGGKFTSCRNLRLQKFENVKAEHFILKEVTPKDFSGTIMLRPESSPKMALGSRLGLTDDGNTIVLADSEGLSWQKYKLTHVYGGYYTITNAKTGLALALADGKFNSGTKVIQTACTKENAQLWKPWKVSSGVLTFTSRLHSERALGVKLSKDGDSFALSRVCKASDKNQRFLTASYTSDQTVGTFAIRSCVDTDRVVEPANSSKVNGKKFLSRDWSGSTRQYFKMLPVVAKGKRGYYYRLVNAATGKLLTVKDNKAKAGTAIVTGSWTGAKGQLWHPAVNSNGTITLVSALGNSLALELKNSSNSYDASLQLGKKTSGKQFRWQLTSMTITSASVSADDHSTVTVTAKGNVTASDDGKIYLFAVNGYSPTVNNYKPKASQTASENVTFTIPLKLDSSASVIQKRFYLGILKNGKYVMASNGFYLTNPEDAAARTTAFPKAASKKGLKLTLSYLDQAVALNCSHAVLDFPIETYLNGSDFAYKYQGKTYYFSSAITWQTQALKKFYDKGIVVTGIFYLSSKLRDYVQPTAASSSGGGTIYALNTKNANRKRLEALFSCLAEEWTKNGIYMANWIYGNESDQYRNYNFTGDVTYDQYHESWAEGFRLFNAAIKSRWKNARTYISLDHNWNLPENGIPSGTYNGQQLTADFNTDLTRQGGIHWDMCMHPYPSPEQDCRIWVPSFYVTDSASSPQITPLNAGAFAAGLKSTYGKNMRVILPETGISSVFQGVTQTAEQAAAVALAYYLTEFDSNLDMIGIHREKDNSAEMAGGWHLGLYYNASGFSQPKPSADVFRYMDTKSWKKHTKAYLKYVTKDGAAISSWADIVPGFKSSKLKKTAS